ncbi:MAG TPA: Ku protein, partial [Solirubrobacterales bacterium]|nr:Ku protein [Solirubrobacterales bacterium]
NVPVKLYSAVARRSIGLREIRESDGTRIRHRRVAEGTDEEVPYEKIIKAYEISKDRYVPLTKEELEALAPEKSRAVEVLDFVDLEEIDPIYFDSPYYLGPADGAEKAYSLLAQAMEKSGKVAIARFVFRNKEHLAAIRPSDGVLTLTTMRFADEVVPPADLDDALPSEQPKIGKREVEMAEQLIDSLTRDFDPTLYRDEYREELLAMIERKAAGEEVMAAPQEEREPTKAPDLMAALEQSIAAVKDKREGRPAKKPAAKKRGAAKAKKPAAKTAAKKKSGSRAKAKSAK